MMLNRFVFSRVRNLHDESTDPTCPFKGFLENLIQVEYLKKTQFIIVGLKI